MASYKVSMENLVTFLLTALCFFCQTSNCQDYSSCGLTLRPVPRGKILGGLESRPGMWPWQVAIFRRTSDDSQRPQFFCGGALINSRWVLSAAHCFHKGPREKYIDYRYTIKAGDHKILSKDPHEQERNAFRIYNHPNYIPSTYENDIALVELDKGVKMGPIVRSICLPKANENISSPGEVVSVAGWGFKTKGSHSSVLLYSAFEIQSNKNCKDKTTYLFNETVMFCAGHGEGGNDTCKGDSGGSTVREVVRDGRRRWVTVGLVSWGEGCGIKGKYGYYTKVEPFVNWIQKKVNGSILSCGHPGKIPNGIINGSDFMVGFTVKYKCNEGYRLRGRSRSRCKRNGNWTKTPSCKKVECRDPGRPRYGVRRPRRKKYHYNNKIRFRCKTNYTIIGRSAIVCRSNGMWSGFKPVCLAPCKDPGIPKGGARLDHSFKHAQTVRFLCRKKNQPPSFSARTCNNGRWNRDIPSCISGCDDPGIPNNGKRRGNDFTVRKRVYFTCDRGFRLIGQNHIQCQSNLQWSDNIPICKAVECADPGKPKNGAKRENKNKYMYEDRIRFQCKKNYTLRGDSLIFCQRDATWTGTLPQCLAPCPDPGVPKGGSRLDHSFKHNDVVRFSCNPGWSMKGFNAIRCQNKRWGYSPPSCVEIGCGRLPELQHGKKIEETSTFFGGKVVFQCSKEGYQLKGSAHRFCQNNGTWSGEQTSCEPVECNDPGKPANSVRRPDKSKFVFEDRLYFQCNTNHTLRGNPFIICQKNKTWTGDAPQCLAPCSDPGIPNGSYRRDHSFKHNNVVRFSCQRSWKMEGTHTIKCNNGRWDHEAPRCLEGCPRPNNRDNMNWSSRKNLYFNGEEVRFTCHGGYKRVGYQRITCRNGKWSSDPPSCKRICGNPGRLNHGLISGFELFEGKEIRFLCYSGYDLFGSQTLRCLPNGRWNASPPECKRRCYNPVIPSNGPTSTPPLLRGQRTKHNTTITFSCRPRYTLEGQQTIRCENGRWSNSNVPVCKAPCSDPGSLQYGQRYGSNFLHGNQVSYTCLGMYMLEGDTRLTCNNGEWDHPKPSCKEPCSNPGSQVKGNKIGSDYRHGKKVDYTCERGTRLVGQSSLTCTDGRWSNTAPECLEICPVLGKPLYGQKIGKSESLSGDKITFRCISGFDLVGSAVLYCDQGQWNGSLPRCLAQCKVPYDLNITISSSPSAAAGQLMQHRKILRFSCLNKKMELDGEGWIICENGTWSDDFPKCKVPCNTDSGSVANGRKHGTRFSVQYWCNNGYTLQGNPNITCMNGKWNSGPPTCEHARCPDPRIPLNGRRIGNNFTHGMTVEFSCDNGYKLEGNHFMKCSNGIWSGSTPTCNDCGSALGMQSGKIPDSNIQASSTRWYYYAKYGRLNGPKAWCSGSEREPYLQIDFGKPYRITGLATQGSVYGNKWVETYVLQSNLAGNSFSVYREDNTDKIFKGNTDSRTIVRQKLKNHLIARRIRIKPVKLGGSYNSPACMRVEVYGCDLPSDCILVGSRIVAKWESNSRGGYKYHKAYLASINSRYWKVELERDGRPIYLRIYNALPFVLDVPPKHEELQVGTRVLAPWWGTYYTSTIKTGRDRDNRYRVRADDGDRDDFTIDQIRLLAAPIFCN